MPVAMFVRRAMVLAWTNPTFVDWRLQSGADTSKPALEEVLVAVWRARSTQRTALVLLVFQ